MELDWSAEPSTGPEPVTSVLPWASVNIHPKVPWPMRLMPPSVEMVLDLIERRCSIMHVSETCWSNFCNSRISGIRRALTDEDPQEYDPLQDVIKVRIIQLQYLVAILIAICSQCLRISRKVFGRMMPMHCVPSTSSLSTCVTTLAASRLKTELALI